MIDPTVVTTHCEIVPVIDKTTELQWKIAVSTGSLCKAICYNTAALLTSPSAFNGICLYVITYMGYFEIVALAKVGVGKTRCSRI